MNQASSFFKEIPRQPTQSLLKISGNCHPWGDRPLRKDDFWGESSKQEGYRTFFDRQLSIIFCSHHKTKEAYFYEKVLSGRGLSVLFPFY